MSFNNDLLTSFIAKPRFKEPLVKLENEPKYDSQLEARLKFIRTDPYIRKLMDDFWKELNHERLNVSMNNDVSESKDRTKSNKNMRAKSKEDSDIIRKIRAINFIQAFIRFKLYRIYRKKRYYEFLQSLELVLANISKRAMFNKLRHSYKESLKKEEKARTTIAKWIKIRKVRKRLRSEYYSKLKYMINNCNDILLTKNVNIIKDLLIDYIFTGRKQIEGEYYVFPDGCRINLNNCVVEQAPTLISQSTLTHDSNELHRNEIPSGSHDRRLQKSSIFQAEKNIKNDNKMFMCLAEQYLDIMKHKLIDNDIINNKKQLTIENNDCSSSKINTKCTTKNINKNSNANYSFTKDNSIKNTTMPKRIETKDIFSFIVQSTKNKKYQISGSINIYKRLSKRSEEISDIKISIVPQRNRLEEKHDKHPKIPANKNKHKVTEIKPALMLIKKKMRERKHLANNDSYEESNNEYSIGENVINAKTMPVKYVSKSPKRNYETLHQNKNISTCKSNDKNSSSNKFISSRTNTPDTMNNTQKFNYLKRKTKKIEPQRLNYKKIENRVNCWNPDYDRNEEYFKKKELTPEKYSYSKNTKSKSQGQFSSNKKKKQTPPKTLKPKPNPNDVDSDTFIDVNTIKDTYMNSYLMKFREINNIEENQKKFNSSLASFNFKRYFNQYINMDKMFKDEENIKFLLKKANQDYTFLMKNK